MNQQFNQPSAAAYPAPPTYTAPEPYATAPPAGYPMSIEESQSQNPVAVETKSRGDDDGFWKGCCAALCCCCAIETCF
ncbi:hypothetical protein V6N13_131678 [Hibiscus sabdariffa]|uniref:Cysteine-rich transmembrane domain-containing protein n=1 Tax=Hibiscus sabdariffa TaxID=183260 RepID=A0ABR2D8Z0_9ROSI